MVWNYSYPSLIQILMNLPVKNPDHAILRSKNASELRIKIYEKLEVMNEKLQQGRFDYRKKCSKPGILVRDAE